MKNKNEIEEMSYSVCNMDNKPKNCADCMWKNTCNFYLSAERYYNADYRKAEEVRKQTAKEILQYMKNVRTLGGVLNWDIETLAKHYCVELD